MSHAECNMTQVECGTVAGPGAGCAGGAVGAAACAACAELIAFDVAGSAFAGGLAGGGGFMLVNPVALAGTAGVKTGVGTASGSGAKSAAGAIVGRCCGGSSTGARCTGLTSGDRLRLDRSSMHSTSACT